MKTEQIHEACALGLQRAKELQMTDISIDLETLGKKPGAPIVAIGLAAFCRKTGEVAPLMFNTIDLGAAIDHSEGVDAPTLKWWLEQDKGAIDQTFNDDRSRVTLYAAIQQIEDIWNYLRTGEKGAMPWGNGATFDVSILEAVFDTVGAPAPWGHWEVRDVRTVVDIGRTVLNIDPKKDFPFQGTRHNAMFDAAHQASYTAAILKKLAEVAGPVVELLSELGTEADEAKVIN